jgi:uncharacterized protein (TIGR02118 family)
MIGVHCKQTRAWGMIRVSVLYPNSDGAKFDKKYYVNSHLPMVKEKLGGALKELAMDEGIAGAAPGSAAPFVAVAHLSFDSLDSFQQAFGANAEAIMGDIPNYTDIEPVVQIGEIKL